MRKARFKVDAINDSFEGYAGNERWNGWEMPYLSKPDLLRLLQHLDEIGNTSFCWSEGNLIETDHDDECSDIVQTINIDGELYYRVGNGWMWEIAPAQTI